MAWNTAKLLGRWGGRILSAWQWVSLAVTAITAVALWLTHQPWPLILAVSVAVCAGLVGLLLGIIELRAKWHEHHDKAKRDQQPNVEFQAFTTADGAVLGVTNRDSADEFHAQIVGLEWTKTDDPSPITPVTLKWVKGDSPSLKIAPGITEFLRIAKLDRFPGAHWGDDPEQTSSGIVSVYADWAPAGSGQPLAVFSYWKDDDFVARFVPRTWSIAVIVSATGKQRHRAQGVRLTLFGQAEDQPDRETLRWPLEQWHMHFPVLYMTLFDVKPTEGRAAPEPYPPLKLGDPRLVYVRGPLPHKPSTPPSELSSEVPNQSKSGA